jgi:hypothetical protein
MWEAVEHDAALVETYRDEFGSCLDPTPDRHGSSRSESVIDGLLRASLVHQRRVNLVGLLGRLDGATMLAGVEGRTPFADARVAAWAESLPISMKFVAGDVEGAPLPGEGGDRRPGRLEGTRSMTLGACRERTKIVLRRAFEGRHDPARAWNLAWPMFNLAMWGRRWGW